MKAKIIVALPGCGAHALAQSLKHGDYHIVDTLDNAPSHLIYVGPAYSNKLRDAIQAALPNHEIEYHCIQLPRYAIDYQLISDINAFNAAIHEFEPVKGKLHAFQCFR